MHEPSILRRKARNACRENWVERADTCMISVAVKSPSMVMIMKAVDQDALALRVSRMLCALPLLKVSPCGL
ncbi:hypothetical protein HYQ46_009299 [Verticillium longisporum]|nr:hypothetical protein HYQ46_009299 [Verticillium longisporum]